MGNLELDKTGRPAFGRDTASYRLDLTADQKSRLEQQPYSSFTFDDQNPRSLVVSVAPESLLYISNDATDYTHRNSKKIRFEHFAQWWRGRRVFAYAGPATAYGYGHEEVNVDAMKVLDDAFPLPFEDDTRREDWDKNEFVLFADELTFIIIARGFLAGSLQCQVKLLSAKTRTKAAVLESLKPLVLSTP